jgi:uncharacterized protein involved in exopolysaccharide biosynthesis
MSAEFSSPRPRSTADEGGLPLVEGGVLGLVQLLVRNRRLVTWYPIGVTLLILAAAFLFPNVYRSTVTILPPERDFQSMSQPTGDLKTFLAGGMSLPVMATPSDILAAVLASRTVRESTVTQLGLTMRWGLSTSGALDKLEHAQSVKVEPSGVIQLLLEDHNRWFADTLANAVVSVADRLNQVILNTKASRTRRFVEERLTDTKAQLDSAADELERFQQEHRTVALDVEVRAMVENAAVLRAQKTSDEIELSVLQESLSPDHPRIRELTARIVQTEQKLSELERAAPGDTTAPSFLGSALMDLPRLSQDLAVRLRNVKVAEALYELLTEQFEHARIQELRDTPTFSVLDPAAHGGTKVRPKRLYIALGTLIVAFMMASIYVVLRSYMSRLALADPARHETILNLWHTMFSRRRGQSRERTP